MGRPFRSSAIALTGAARFFLQKKNDFLALLD
jgi:hypothetical protein